ncbi:hypothetical protein TNCV_4603311 [Trichonephila clavipes]|nr:hypothetical protein TNCV_4603311 [Trichonephila clavipes]
MVWGCVAAFGVESLMESCTRWLILIYRQIIGKKVLINWDWGRYSSKSTSTSKHTAFVVKEWLLTHCGNQLNTPPQSPDLNVIKNLLSHLGESYKKETSNYKQGTIEIGIVRRLFNIAPETTRHLRNRCLGDWKLSYQQKRLCY